MIRPQQKRQKKTREMQNELSKGDRIVTIGGIHGTVDVIEDNQVVIKSHGSTKLTFDRSAIREILDKKENPHQKPSLAKKDEESKKENKTEEASEDATKETPKG